MNTTNPRITSRNLLAALLQQVEPGQRPFGGITVLSPDQPIWTADIPKGDVAKYLATRIERFGVDVGIADGITTVDAAVLQLANALVPTITDVAKKARPSIGADTAFRIALEYATQAVFLPVGEVQPLNEYLSRALELRAAYRRYNAVTNAVTEAAFLGVYADVAAICLAATSARHAIETACGDSRHLRTLRASLQARIVPDVKAWVALKALEPTTRKAAVSHLLNEVGRTGNDQITEADVTQAIAQIQGNTLLSRGTPTGITIATAVDALATSPFAKGQDKDGGQRFVARGMSISDLGHNMAGLHGQVDEVLVENTGNGTLRVTANIVDSDSSEFDPATMTVPTQGTWFDHDETDASFVRAD